MHSPGGPTQQPVSHAACSSGWYLLLQDLQDPVIPSLIPFFCEKLFNSYQEVLNEGKETSTYMWASHTYKRVYHYLELSEK